MYTFVLCLIAYTASSSLRIYLNIHWYKFVGKFPHMCSVSPDQSCYTTENLTPLYTGYFHCQGRSSQNCRFFPILNLRFKQVGNGSSPACVIVNFIYKNKKDISRSWTVNLLIWRLHCYQWAIFAYTYGSKHYKIIHISHTSPLFLC